MKTIQIPIYRTFTNWLITVVIGSVLLPFTSFFLGGNPIFSHSNQCFNDDTLGLIGISAIVSAVCSLPALILLFIAHLLLNRRQPEFKNHQLIQNAIHIGVSVLTFAVFAYNLGGDDDFLAAISLTYPLVGLVVWNITYAIYRKRAPISNDVEEVLDL